jgi:hypothetical protein
MSYLQRTGFTGIDFFDRHQKSEYLKDGIDVLFWKTRDFN